MAGRPPSDPHRAARYREEARGIVANDRHNRKYGHAVDTAGAIARALERAFKEGFEAAQVGAPAPVVSRDEIIYGDDALDWNLIPPRPRNAFWSICLFALGRDPASDIPKPPLQMMPTVSDRGASAWTVVGKDGVRDQFGERTLVPLVRLGLLSLVKQPEDRLILTDRAKLTWWRFIADGGDFP